MRLTRLPYPSRPSRPAAALVVTVVALGLCAASPVDARTEKPTSAQMLAQAAAGRHAVIGRVVLGKGVPIVGATVTVCVGTGTRRVCTRDRTQRDGVFLALVPGYGRPASLTSRGGTALGRRIGTLSADVTRLRQGRGLWITPATTVAQRARRGTRLSSAAALRRAHRALALPPGLYEGGLGRISSGFDARELMRRAGSRGLSPLLDRIAAAARRGAVYGPITASRGAGSRAPGVVPASVGPGSADRRLQSAAASQGLIGTVATLLANGAISAVGGTAMGYLLDVLGIGTQAALDTIESDLSTMQTQLNGISSQITDMDQQLSTQLNGLSQQVTQLSATLQSDTNQLANQAAQNEYTTLADQLTGGVGPVVVLTGWIDQMSMLAGQTASDGITPTLQASANDLQNALGSSAPNVWALSSGISNVLFGLNGATPLYVQLSSALTTGLQFYPYSSSQGLQNAYGYYLGVATQLFELQEEYAHALGSSTMAQQGVTNYNTFLGQQAAIQPDGLPAGTTVDLRQGLYLNASGQSVLGMWAGGVMPGGAAPTAQTLPAQQAMTGSLATLDGTVLSGWMVPALGTLASLTGVPNPLVPSAWSTATYLQTVAGFSPAMTSIGALWGWNDGSDCALPNLGGVQQYTLQPAGSSWPFSCSANATAAIPGFRTMGTSEIYWNR